MEVIPHRQDELNQIKMIYNSEQRNRELGVITFRHWSPVLLLGITGTGKTTISHTALDFFPNNLKKMYAVCSTSTATMRSLMNEKKNIKDFQQVYQKFKENLTDPTIIVLDEIDKLISADDYDLLYYLSREPKVWLITISNKPSVLSMIKDKSVRSSFMPRTIFFNEYNPAQLTDILIHYGHDKNFSKEDLGFIANKIFNVFGGDARALLEIIDYITQFKNGNIDSTLSSAMEWYQSSKVMTLVQTLSIPESRLLDIVLRERYIPLNKVYQKYNSIYPPFSAKTLSSILDKLVKKDLIAMEIKGNGRAKGQSFFVRPTMETGESPEILPIVRSNAKL